MSIPFNPPFNPPANGDAFPRLLARPSDSVDESHERTLLYTRRFKDTGDDYKQTFAERQADWKQYNRNAFCEP